MKQLEVNITNLTCSPVFKWSANNKIPKGPRHNHEALNKCKDVKEKFLCYYWASDNEVMYIGSVSKNYTSKGKTDTNLSQRIAQYFGNHKTRNKNSKEVHNTNFRIFRSANEHLSRSALELGTFKFETAHYNGTEKRYEDCSSDADFVRMLEHVLISHFRNQGQCKWNA